VEVLEAIRTRRSVRSFKDDRISDEDAAKILEAARWAPSAGNKQPWSFIYIKDPQVLRMIKNCSPGFYADATATIVVGIDKKDEQRGVLDVCFAAENILLAAHALGIGSCPIVSFNGDAVREIVNAPETWQPILVISLGYPDKIPSPPSKKELSEIAYIDFYGRKWPKLEVP
jgi:nitroreductase